MSEKRQHDWFWSHRRNASIHHLSLLMPGLANNGWLPVVDFTIQHVISVYEPGKGSYIFYDRDELSQNGIYPAVEKSIIENPNFITEFRRRTDEIFGALHFHVKHINEANLPLASNEELQKLWFGYRDALMVGPLITVQLWGIEALFDPQGTLMKWLTDTLLKKDILKELQQYRESLAIIQGETIAFTEQKQLLRVLAAISTAEILELALSDTDNFIKGLRTEYSEALSLIRSHIDTYEWVHTEYQGTGWTEDMWLSVIREELRKKKSPADRLVDLEEQFASQQELYTQTVKNLAPPENIHRLMFGLSEFIAQRDWTKGYFVQSLTSYHKLLTEIAKRNKLTFDDLLLYTEKEVKSLLVNKQSINSKELLNRKEKRSVFISHNGVSTIESDSDIVAKRVSEEGLAGPFEKTESVEVIRGSGVSKGLVRARARVLEQASDLHTLKDGEIIVTYMTTVEFTPAFRTAAAVVTDEGGMACHAAITSREYGIPAVVGTQIATRVIQTGDMIEVDGTQGVVTLIHD